MSLVCLAFICRAVYHTTPNKGTSAYRALLCLRIDITYSGTCMCCSFLKLWLWFESAVTPKPNCAAFRQTCKQGAYRTICFTEQKVVFDGRFLERNLSGVATRVTFWVKVLSLIIFRSNQYHGVEHTLIIVLFWCEISFLSSSPSPDWLTGIHPFGA